MVKCLPWVLLWIAFHAKCQSSLQEGSFGLVTWPEPIPPVLQDSLEDKVVSCTSNQGGAKVALKDDGEVVTWGSNAKYYGGDSSAVKDQLLGNVTTIFGTISAFAALKAGGEVVTWGLLEAGGDSSAVKDRLLGNVTTIFSTSYAFAALKAGGEVVTWGPSLLGGNSSAVKDQLLGNVMTIFSTSGAFAALKAGGEVVSWGNSWHGGDSSAVKDQLLGNVKTIFSTSYAFAALKAGGEVVSWGLSAVGGDSSAVKDQLLGNVMTIFSNMGAFAALKASGEVVTWGSSWQGADSSVVKDQLLGNVTTIFGSSGAFAALKASGEVVTWGSSEVGGDSSAVKDRLLGNVTAIFSTSGAFAALKAGGEVVTWGSSEAGGDSSAVKDQLLGNVMTIFSTANAFAALKAGGEAVIWGFTELDPPAVCQPSSAEQLSRRVSAIIPMKGDSCFAALICIPRRPSGKDLKPSCELCNPDEFWTGVVEQCDHCQHPHVPNFDQSSCELCGAGFAPDITNTFCTECSGNFFAEAGSSECKMCDMGKVSHDDKSDCRFCALDQIAEDGSCRSCPYLHKPDEAQIACMLDFYSMPMMFIYIVLLSMLMKLLFTIFFSRYVVIDVSLQQGKTILTTLKNHNLSCFPCRPNFPILLQGTCHPGLDGGSNSKPKVAKAKTQSSNTLELLDAEGNSINESFDTSSGTFSLTYANSCLHVSLISIPLVLPAIVFFAIILLIAIYSFTAIEAGVITSLSLLSSITFLSFRTLRESRKKTPLQRKLREFRCLLSTVNPNPTSCPKGPGRAINLDKLLELHHFFRAFIQDRTAYYLDGNILKPLTAKHRLSYAELVGPDQVDFFVSHFWGTEFTHFCGSLQKHAETFTREMLQRHLAQPPVERQQVAYWICFCSNNQYDLHNELGGDIGWQESSFYLALQSPTCQSTCMVLDDKALPLTRSWCIFETLQALKISLKQTGFDLLLCTASGVLNFGNGSIEAALGIVRRVASMNLQDAHATNEADKMMIDRLVIDEMGSFEELNNFIRKEIHIILKTTQKTCSSEFENLLNVVESAMSTAALASTSQNAQQSDEDEGLRHSELHQVYGELRHFELHQVYGGSYKTANVVPQVKRGVFSRHWI